MMSRRVNPRRRKVQESSRQPSPSRIVSGIIGIFLLALAVLWLAWLVVHQLTGGAGFSILPLPGQAPAIPTVAQVPPLTAAGIMLGTPSKPAAISQQQALILAGQLEPDAAAKAGKTSQQYVLLNYRGTNSSSPQRTFSNAPAWMIWYQQIPQQPADTSADPVPRLSSHHDLYVFLDANTGKELLVIWA